MNVQPVLFPAPEPPDLDEERRARLTLNLIAEPGDWAFLAVAHEIGGIALLRAIHEDPRKHELLEAAAARLAGVDVDRTMEEADRLGLRFVIPGDDEWPGQVQDLYGQEPISERGGPPIGLWVKGPVRLDTLGESVAIVGSRSSTSYGESVAADIAAQVGHAGIPVVSGAAYGIDYAAHRGALSTRAPTVAVLACGADRVYPTAHRQLLEHLGREHAVVSEAPPGHSPQRIRFLARNRLIAALSKGTVVVEAAYRSGAISTVNWAARLNRVVMGVPGPITVATTAGVHQLIRNHVATLVTSGDDVLELIGKAGEHVRDDPRGPDNPRDLLTFRERQVLDAVPVAQSAGVDSIAVVAGLGVAPVRRALEGLLQKGFVEMDHSGWHLTDLAMT